MDKVVAERIEHIIVHVEDDAEHWASLAFTLETAIEEHLALSSNSDDLASLDRKPPPTAYEYPSLTTISWKCGEQQYCVHYWLVKADRVDAIVDEIRGKSNLTFVLDVMRSAQQSGLYSSLPQTLTSIQEFVTDQSKQVRLFTAYSAADGVQFPENPPMLIKKGVQTKSLIAFLLGRIGFGRA